LHKVPLTARAEFQTVQESVLEYACFALQIYVLQVLVKKK